MRRRTMRHKREYAEILNFLASVCYAVQHMVYNNFIVELAHLKITLFDVYIRFD